MAEISLVAEVREVHGSASSRRLRTAGRIPGVLYGHGAAPVAVSVDARALRSGLSSAAGANALFELEVGGVRHLAIPRQLQRHPVRRTVSHVDFQVVRRDELVSAEVPLVLVGEALSVHRAGGTVEHLLVSLPVKAKPGDIPTSIEIDLSGLELGDSVRVGDLTIPEGVTVEADPSTAVVVALALRGSGDGAEPTADADAATVETTVEG